MSDPNKKTYAFGELNPVEGSMVQKRMNSRTTDPMRAMRDAALEQYTPNSLEGTGPMKGIVLMVEEDPTSEGDIPPGDWMSAFFGMEEGEEARLPVLKRYKVRIPELHAMMPEPSKYAESSDETGEHMAVISRYPTFIAKDTAISEEHEAKPGDLVWVDFGDRVNQTDPVYLGMLFPPASGPGGNNRTTNPHNSPCGGLGGGRAGGGALSPDQRSRLSSSGAHFGSPLYLPYTEIKKRNKASPSYGVLRNSKYLGSETKQKEHIAAGGHKTSDGKAMAISGRMAPGSCSTISNRCARILMAQRIVAEDNADRGYKLGGKSVTGTIGGIDCSGFVQTVRGGAEYLCSADGQYFGLPDRKKSGKTVRWHNAWAHSSWQYNSGQHTNIMGQKTAKYVPNDSIYPMPGDEVCMASKTGPTADFAKGRTWGGYAHGVTHVGICITDPEGNLRFAESGGPHSGVGSMRWEQWWDRTGRKKNVWIWQPKEMDAAWQSVGGRPSKKWTPELAKQLVPELFTNNLNSRASGEQETSRPTVDGTESSRASETKTEEQKAAEEAKAKEGKAEEEKKRIEEAKAKLPKLEEELKALETSKGKDSPEYKAKKKEYDDTKAIAEGKASNTPANQGSGQNPSNTTPSPARCTPGGSGQVGGGTGGPTNANGTSSNPYTPKPPKVSDVRDAVACPKYSDKFLGSVDQNTSLGRKGFDFIAIHDGGTWGSANDEVACKRLISMFKNKKGSYNYFIGGDGTIYQLISEKLVAWASACYRQKVKTWKGQERATCSFLKANYRSIAITLRNNRRKSGGSYAYTPEQAKAVKCLLEDISRRRGIPLSDETVVAHHEIQKLNHYDPIRFPMERPNKATDFDWKSLGSGFNYDHAVENYGDHFPHKVTG